MTAHVIRLVPTPELTALHCYLNSKDEPDSLEEFYDAIGVPANPTPSRLNVAVAQIILSHVQGGLPQWYSGRKGVFGRKRHERHEAARLAFQPQEVFCVNWADTAPGISWPESYHVTYIPGFDKHVVTASRDGDDAWGCVDHAIGFAEGHLSSEEAARQAITAFWQYQYSSWDQSRWAYLFAQGIVDTDTADSWAKEIWESEEHS